MSVSRRARAAASRHASILRDIGTLDDGASALSQQSTLVQDLQTRTRAAEGALEALERITRKGRTQFTSRRDSSFRKLGSRLVGKGHQYKEGVDQRERQYSQALEAEVRARTERDELRSQLQAAEQKHEALSTAHERSRRLHAELDEMYESVFGGSTTELPEDRRLGELVRVADEEHLRAQTRFNNATRALSLLTEALAKMEFCLSQLRAASSPAQSNGPGLAPFQEDLLHSMAGTKALHAARALASETDALVVRSQECLPSIRQPTPLVISPDRMTDQQLRQWIADKSMREVANESAKQASMVTRQLDAEREEVQATLVNLRDDISQKAAAVERARAELRSMRQSAFQDLVDGTGNRREPERPKPTSGKTGRDAPGLPTDPPLYSSGVPISFSPAPSYPTYS